MKFKQIEICNFGTIGNVTLSLQARGMVLVAGLNKDTPKSDSNGAGKSLLLDAFTWCLWGRTTRDTKDDEVVNNKFGKNCQVTVYFEDGDQEFKVIRYRKSEVSKKPNDLELYVNGADLSSANMRTTQSVISGLVGLTFETFCALMPGSGRNAAQMTDADIKALLENMLQITALAKAKVRADTRTKELKLDLATNTQTLMLLRKQLAKDEARLADLQRSEGLFESTQSARAANLNKELQAILLKMAPAAELIRLGTASRSDHAALEARQKDLLADRASGAKTIAAIGAKHAADREKHKATRSELVGALRVRRDALAAYSKLGTSCPQCCQGITPDYMHQLHNKDASACEALVTQIQEVDQLLDQSLQAEELDTTSYLAEQKSLSQKIDNLATRMRDLASYIEVGARAEIQLAGLTQVSDRIRAELMTLALTGNPYTTMVSAEIAGITASTVLATSLTDVCTALRTKIDYLEFWREAFSAQGIRSFILDNVTPVLNERAKHYCDLLTDGEMGIDFSTKTALKDGELREKFSINIHQKHGGTSYLSNSKGERQRANLAVAFALSDLAELHSNKRVDFRFLDEPFEGVDESGTEAIVALLQELQKRYPTVFIVTHQGHFKDVFPVQITVVKEDGVSRLEEQHGTTTTTGLQ